jgi:hypothetical protein
MAIDKLSREGLMPIFMVVIVMIMRVLVVIKAPNRNSAPLKEKE